MISRTDAEPMNLGAKLKDQWLYLSYKAGDRHMKLIIFDVYGTLISTVTGSLDAAKKFWHYKIKILIDRLVDNLGVWCKIIF